MIIPGRVTAARSPRLAPAGVQRGAVLWKRGVRRGSEAVRCARAQVCSAHCWPYVTSAPPAGRCRSLTLINATCSISRDSGIIPMVMDPFLQKEILCTITHIYTMTRMHLAHNITSKGITKGTQNGISSQLIPNCTSTYRSTDPGDRKRLKIV